MDHDFMILPYLLALPKKLCFFFLSAMFSYSHGQVLHGEQFLGISFSKGRLCCPKALAKKAPLLFCACPVLVQPWPGSSWRAVCWISFFKGRLSCLKAMALKFLFFSVPALILYSTNQ
eukprot:46452-Ditylum_brightwellii.AAC.1